MRVDFATNHKVGVEQEEQGGCNKDVLTISRPEIHYLSLPANLLLIDVTTVDALRCFHVLKYQAAASTRALKDIKDTQDALNNVQKRSGEQLDECQVASEMPDIVVAMIGGRFLSVGPRTMGSDINLEMLSMFVSSSPL